MMKRSMVVFGVLGLLLGIVACSKSPTLSQTDEMLGIMNDGLEAGSLVPTPADDGIDLESLAPGGGMAGRVQSLNGSGFKFRANSGRTYAVYVNGTTRFAPAGYSFGAMRVGHPVRVNGKMGQHGAMQASYCGYNGNDDDWGGHGNMGMYMTVKSIGSSSFGVDGMMGGGMMGNNNTMTITVSNDTKWSPSGFGLGTMKVGDTVQVYGIMTDWHTMAASSVSKTDGNGGGGCGGGGMGH